MDTPEKLSPTSQEVIDKILELGQFLLKFSRVERAPYHEDGQRRETDADHTVMLATVACAFAEKFKPELNRGLIAQFALVHDMVETYSGDVVTLNIDEQGRKRKEAAEKKAMERIDREFGEIFPWLPGTIKKYESLDTPEARFVKAIDKCMPGITHVLNKNAYLHEVDFDFEKYEQQRVEQHKKIHGHFMFDQPEVIELKDALWELILEIETDAND